MFDLSPILLPLAYRVTDLPPHSYVAYEALCLFFTSPLVLFSTPILTTMKRTAFRMPKVHFICVVVVVW